MKRRNFIALSTLSTVGIIVKSSKVSQAVDRRSVLSYAEDFGQAVEFSTKARSVNSYLNTSNDFLLNQVIYDTNSFVSQMGFSDLSSSTVYGDPNNLYYPVQHQDGLNICVPFLNSNRFNPSLTSLLEGPSLIGMTKAAEDIRSQYSASVVRKALYPVEEINPGRGTFQTGYETPARFLTSDNNCVTIDYQNISPWEGRVEVTVESESDSGSGMKEIFYDVYSVGYA